MKKSQFEAALLAGCFAALLMTGCSLFSPGRISAGEYDLAVSPVSWTPPADFPRVMIGTFRNSSGANRALLHRSSENRMSVDETNRLYQPVEFILTREFQRLFVHGGNRAGDYIRLSGTVLRFEIDDAGKRAVVELELTAESFAGDSRQKIFRHLFTAETPLKDDSPDSAFEALSTDVRKILREASSLLPREFGKTAGNANVQTTTDSQK